MIVATFDSRIAKLRLVHAAASPSKPSYRHLAGWRSQPGGVTRDKGRRVLERDSVGRPARSRASGAGCVPAEAGDHGVDVPGVAVNGDPIAFTRFSPCGESSRVERRRDQPSAVQGETDRT